MATCLTIVAAGCSRVSDTATDLRILSETPEVPTTIAAPTTTTARRDTTTVPVLRPHDGPLVTTACVHPNSDRGAFQPRHVLCYNSEAIRQSVKTDGQEAILSRMMD